MNAMALKQEIDKGTRIDIRNAFLSITCRCGALKRTKQPFCNTCYDKLPRQYQVALYKRLGEGFEEAYQRAAYQLEVQSVWSSI